MRVKSLESLNRFIIGHERCSWSGRLQRISGSRSSFFFSSSPIYLFSKTFRTLSFKLRLKESIHIERLKGSSSQDLNSHRARILLLPIFTLIYPVQLLSGYFYNHIEKHFQCYGRFIARNASPSRFRYSDWVLALWSHRLSYLVVSIFIFMKDEICRCNRRSLMLHRASSICQEAERRDENTHFLWLVI